MRNRNLLLLCITHSWTNDETSLFTPNIITRTRCEESLEASTTRAKNCTMSMQHCLVSTANKHNVVSFLLVQKVSESLRLWLRFWVSQKTINTYTCKWCDELGCFRFLWRLSFLSRWWQLVLFFVPLGKVCSVCSVFKIVLLAFPRELETCVIKWDVITLKSNKQVSYSSKAREEFFLWNWKSLC